MLYLYLDGSGDPGFDFFGKKPVTILTIKGVENNRALVTAAKKTIRRKLYKKS